MLAPVGAGAGLPVATSSLRQAHGSVGLAQRDSVHLPTPSTLCPLAAAARCVFGMIQK